MLSPGASRPASSPPKRLGDLRDLLRGFGFRQQDDPAAAADHGLDIGFEVRSAEGVDAYRGLRVREAARAQGRGDVLSGLRLLLRGDRVLQVEQQCVGARLERPLELAGLRAGNEEQ